MSTDTYLPITPRHFSPDPYEGLHLMVPGGDYLAAYGHHAPDVLHAAASAYEKAGGPTVTAWADPPTQGWARVIPGPSGDEGDWVIVWRDVTPDDPGAVPVTVARLLPAVPACPPVTPQPAGPDTPAVAASPATPPVGNPDAGTPQAVNDPTTITEEWCVWVGGEHPDDAAVRRIFYDEADAREDYQWLTGERGRGIAVRAVATGPWRIRTTDQPQEATAGDLADDSGCGGNCGCGTAPCRETAEP